ncbi:MAG: glutamine amidotransferase [Altererythrobacter sp. 66-12]|nr:MAG: glutamine amidotransferase [Altererythrobacter sp. 66-12]
MKRALIVRHVPVEGIAGYREPVEAAGYRIDRVDVADPGFATLDFAEPDLLILMGGPMSVYEQDRHPWIASLLHRLAGRLERDRPTLGVCLGAQMIAAALGARVYGGPRKEVGYSALTIRHPLLRHLEDRPVLLWHGDTFERPEGTEWLASSELYENQGFRRGANVLALQFHAEMGRDERFDTWVDAWPHDVAAVGTTAERLRADHAAFGPPSLAAGQAVMAEWLAGLD